VRGAKAVLHDARAGMAVSIIVTDVQNLKDKARTHWDNGTTNRARDGIIGQLLIRPRGEDMLRRGIRIRFAKSQFQKVLMK